MPKPHKFTIQQVREHLLEHGPKTTGELVSALGIRSSGTFGRILALHAEGAGLIRFRQLDQGRLRVFWKADPYYRPPYQSSTTEPETLSPPPRPEQESANRLAENVRRFRLERQQEKGGRRRA